MDEGSNPRRITPTRLGDIPRVHPRGPSFYERVAQENRAAELMHGRMVPGPGDVKYEKLSYDNKNLKAENIRLRDDVARLEHEMQIQRRRAELAERGELAWYMRAHDLEESGRVAETPGRGDDQLDHLNRMEEAVAEFLE